MKKFLALLLVVVMVLGLVACNKTDDDQTAKEYTYRSYTTALGTNWNPHSWEMNADDAIQQYLSTPLVTMQILNSEEETWQWVYVAATSIEDVTKDHLDDLTKYGSDLGDLELNQIEKDYVYEIKLNKEMKWEDGTPINADTYIYSMKQLLDPKMRNYRSNLYWGGESAIAGGKTYYDALQKVVYVMLPYDQFASKDPSKVFVDAWDSWGAEGYVDADGKECPQYLCITDTHEYNNEKGDDPTSGKGIFDTYEGGGYYAAGEAVLFEEVPNENYTEDYEATYDSTVGCYKVDDYTFRYVMAAPQDIDNFRISCASNWLVYEKLYEENKDTTGDLVTTKYCTSKETTMSYGPYKIESLQDGKQIVFVQNENYYTFKKNSNGTLSAETPYLVDGKHVTQYQTTRIEIDVMEDATAKQAFLKGELDDWTPPADEMTNYTSSEQMYKVDESYTQRLFFHTNLDSLKTMDESGGNQNSVVLSNRNFRKAMSLAIDRADWVLATAGYKPAFGLMNRAYYYDFFNDPTSRYRDSEPAMKAIVDMYGIKYGEGTPYPTLKDAYQSVSGYNLTEAKELMKTACKELVEEGLYKEGDPIKIRLAWMKPAMDTVAQAQIDKLSTYLNAAVEGTGFGKITLEGVGNLNDRYGDVINGTYAIGYGAWGGATLYPFRTLAVYVDPQQAGKIHEGGCWDPTSTNLTLTVDGKEITQTWQWWGTTLATGELRNLPNETKLEILAELETRLLDLYYMIPLASTCSASLLGYKLQYYTNSYNDAYGFGGIELMTYKYDDAAWDEYVKSMNYQLNYE